MTYWFLHATRSQNARQSSSSQHSGCDPLLFDIHLSWIREASFCSGVFSVKHAIKNKIIILSPLVDMCDGVVCPPMPAVFYCTRLTPTTEFIRSSALRLNRPVQTD